MVPLGGAVGSGAENGAEPEAAAAAEVDGAVAVRESMVAPVQVQD